MEVCQSITSSYNTLLYENYTLDANCMHTSGYITLHIPTASEGLISLTKEE